MDRVTLWKEKEGYFQFLKTKGGALEMRVPGAQVDEQKFWKIFVFMIYCRNSMQPGIILAEVAIQCVYV